MVFRAYSNGGGYVYLIIAKSDKYLWIAEYYNHAYNKTYCLARNHEVQNQHIAENYQYDMLPSKEELSLIPEDAVWISRL